MRSLRFSLAAIALGLAVGCSFIEKWRPDRGDRPATPVQKVVPEQLVTYLNERASRIQTLTYGEARLTASDHGIPLPALRGNLAASQPRNFRMTGQGGAMGAKVDLGSNPDQFWVYFDAPAMKPMFVFASHSDFEQGRAKLPGGIPFEPDWVMQALGMTTFPPNPQYTANLNERDRTYILSWPAVTPNGVAIRKEVIFDADDATGTRPQVKKHLVKDAKGKLLCSAEVKTAKTVQIGGTDPRTGLPLAVQHPTRIVLRWEEQKFEMDMTLDSAQVNQTLSDEQARRLFNRPNIPGASAVNLAQFESPIK